MSWDQEVPDNAPRFGTLTPNHREMVGRGKFSIAVREVLGSSFCDESGLSYKLCRNAFTGEPLIKSDKTDRDWSITWAQLLGMARACGIDDDVCPPDWFPDYVPGPKRLPFPAESVWEGVQVGVMNGKPLYTHDLLRVLEGALGLKEVQTVAPAPVVDQPTVGAELDRAVALNVMGWSMYHYDKDHADACYWMLLDEDVNPVAEIKRLPTGGFDTGERKTEAEAWADCPAFSTASAAFLQVVDKVTGMPAADGDHYHVTMQGGAGVPWVVAFHHPLASGPNDPMGFEWHQAIAGTAAEAVCRAALTVAAARRVSA